jgi:hypothetical protein
MKMYGGVDVWIHISVISAIVGAEWWASRPSFTLGERSPDTHWIWGWVNSRAGLDDVKRKFFLPGLELRLIGRPARSQLLYWLCHHVFFFFKTHFNIIFSFTSRYSKRLRVHFISHHAYYISNQSHFVSFDCHNYICCTLVILKTIRFLPSSC